MSDGMICKNGNELTAVPDSIEGTFVIPPEISIIGENAFCGTSLTEVEIPGHVRVIGPKAFDRGHKLRKAVMEEGVEALGYKSFAHCEALSEIIIPRSVKTIDFKAFMGCDSLKSVTVSKDCQVADDAFEPGVEIKYYD
ncbi:MAG: leucine-rich repeat domain-containing protein [Enterocloster asparagiformis]|nr:leucine-rich repeat domain-containing protein [Enterocloster asparagiformis]